MTDRRIVVGLLVAVGVAAHIALVPEHAGAQASPVAAAQTAGVPDFTGVYYPFQQGRGGGAPGARAGGAPAPGARGNGPLPPPTRLAPLSDLSQGRAPNAPKLTPEYMAKWEVIRKSRMSGSSEFDNSARCIPQGMPAMMAMTYGMEVMQTKDKITFFGELNDQYRRVYLDGRKPSQKVLNDPTYIGYSTGRWEGDTLVVDTVAIHEGAFIDGSSPHSDQITVRERIRFSAPDVIEDRITVTDPIALLEPWEIVRTYRRAAANNDELREAACPEGLDRAK